MTFEEARAQFPVLERYAYLNAGTNGPIVRATADAVIEQMRRDLEHGRSGKAWVERILELREEARTGLAAVLGVNKNTVLRALHLLRAEGLLEFRRGRGITVVGTPQRGAVLAKAQELVDFARHQGFRRDEVIDIIESLP